MFVTPTDIIVGGKTNYSMIPSEKLKMFGKNLKENFLEVVFI